MKYDAIIFDIDGTLWDATETSTYGWNEALKSLGSNRVISETEMGSVTGKPIEECVKILLPDENNKCDNLLEKLITCEKEAIRKAGGILYSDCIETIRSLYNRYALLLVSNYQEWYLDLLFNHSGCKKYFLDYNCHGMSGSSKAVMLQHFKEKYCLRNPVYIGDTESDKTAAEEAGFDFIFAGYGFGNLSGSVKGINSLSDLNKILK